MIKVNRGILNTLFVMILLVFLGLGIRRIVLNVSEAKKIEAGDYLVYVRRDYSDTGWTGQLMLYDPSKDVHTPILRDWNIDRISLGAGNRMAFSSSHEGSSEIYILNYPFVDSVPTSITHNIATQNQPIAWSPDGQYLAYWSAQDDRGILSLWDGKISSHIYNFQKISEVTWSLDNQLAFTEFYGFSSLDGGGPSEIFIWDGNETVSLSQNPTGTDRFPAWNANGQLAFLSEREGEYDIFIWDGVSKINGMPDPASFVNIAPNLTGYYSNPVWTNSDLLTFTGAQPKENIQIYEWDGQRATNISRNLDFHNGSQSWRSDGYWVFGTSFLSDQQLLYARNEKNRTVLTTEGGSPAWSPRGLLLFCVKAPRGWTLFMWNGAKIVEIAQGYEIDASWQNGEETFCTSG